MDIEIERDSKDKIDKAKDLSRAFEKLSTTFKVLNREINPTDKPTLTIEQDRREKWGLSNPKFKKLLSEARQDLESTLQALDKVASVIELTPGERFIEGDKDYTVIERDNVPGYRIVIDKRQNLEIIQGPDKDTTWHDAKAFTEEISNKSGQNFRLPTREELKGLYDESKVGNYRTDFLPIRSDMEGDSVWSGERCYKNGTLYANGQAAKAFSFDGGQFYSYPLSHSYFRVFAVRDRT
jgi:hypothetical protein